MRFKFRRKQPQTVERLRLVLILPYHKKFPRDVRKKCAKKILFKAILLSERSDRAWVREAHFFDPSEQIFDHCLKMRPQRYACGMIRFYILRNQNVQGWTIDVKYVCRDHHRSSHRKPSYPCPINIASLNIGGTRSVYLR